MRRPSGLIRTTDRSAPANRTRRGINGVLEGPVPEGIGERADWPAEAVPF
jgi:hypothetical protein